MRILMIIGLGLLISACDGGAEEVLLQGYAEGRQHMLAPRTSGIITALNVREGDDVTVGSHLFTVDDARARTLLDAAIAAKEATASRLENLRKGGRPEEVLSATEDLNSAKAALNLAEQDFARSQELVADGAASQARVDQDRARLDEARARVAQADARLALVRLPAREDEIRAAEHDLASAIARAENARLELEERSVSAPAVGRIETIYRRVGEVAGPGQPVLAMLTPDQMRIRFFVPEPLLASLRAGGKVDLFCDSCGDGLAGTISYISDRAEFTPPVIFTETERAKLVYMVEAIPDQPEAFLNGQPVDVKLP